MLEIAVFSEWVAAELIARGFAPVGKSKLAWFFEDSEEVERALSGLLELME